MEERIGFGQRLLAAVIDVVVIAVAGGILGFVLGGVLGAGAGAVLSGGEAGGAAVGGFLGALAGAERGVHLLSLVWIVWEGLTGAALGKTLLKIRAKSEDGTRATPDKLFLRAALKYSGSLLRLIAGLTGITFIGSLGHLAGLLIFVGCFFVLGEKRQAFHDMLAKTAVYRD